MSSGVAGESFPSVTLTSRFMLRIPHLTTDRLLLRGFVPDDFEPYAAMMANPDVARYLGDGRPLTCPEAWRQMAMFAGHWVLRGFGLWAVEERSTGRFIGRIGCLEPEGFPAFEIAYTLAPEAWGKGYAREGAGAALCYARDVLGRTAITSICTSTPNLPHFMNTQIPAPGCSQFVASPPDSLGLCIGDSGRGPRSAPSSLKR